MPVDNSSAFQPVRAILVAVFGIALAVGFMILILRLTPNDGIEVKLGDDTFEAGEPELMATIIDRDGPIPYADLVGKGRDIYLQHLGTDPLDGWYAFDARLPGAASECPLDWEANDGPGPAGLFVDRCDPTKTVTADGGDLPHYPVTIADGTLSVDLNASQRTENDQEDNSVDDAEINAENNTETDG